MEAVTIKAFTQDRSKIDALKAVMKALNINFELSKDTPYDPEFIAKIEEGDRDLEAGKGRKVSMEELNSLWK